MPTIRGKLNPPPLQVKGLISITERSVQIVRSQAKPHTAESAICVSSEFHIFCKKHATARALVAWQPAEELSQVGPHAAPELYIRLTWRSSPGETALSLTPQFTFPPTPAFEP